MRKTMPDWFFMRPGFDSFLIEPETKSEFLYGTKDRAQRDQILGSLEETAYSNNGHKTVVYGDYGRGKTHQCQNIIYEIKRRDLPFVPVYIKCGAYTRKEPFFSFFSAMIGQHSTQMIMEVARNYQRDVMDEKARPIDEIVNNEDIARVLSSSLSTPNEDTVKNSMRWLSGEPKVDMSFVGSGLKPQLKESAEFGDVVRGIAHLFISVLGKVPLYIVDESERFQQVADSDTYFSWLASLRELTEIHKIALIIVVGARNRDFLPNIFVQPEIVRRIGAVNYVEFLNPGPQDLREFIVEQLQTTIRKGEVPESQSEVIQVEARDPSIPAELLEMTGGDADALECYPFLPDAFEEFVSELAGSDYSNKPSEAQLRLQKAAQRAMRLDKKRIDLAIVNDMVNEGF
jgi:Cdc6-like AAA superfamily ATPase